MLVTINVDASFHPKFKVGAFAFWIVCDQTRITYAGALKEVNRAEDAELMGIANALYTLLKSQIVNVHRIVINNDCTYAHNRVGKKSDKIGKKVWSLLRSLRKKYGIEGKAIHEFRYVKAHSGTETKRQWVNEWCDKKAKEQLWAVINSK